MKTLDLGKVAISPKGVYDVDTSYDPLDLIQYNGSAYLVKKPVTGITPSDGEDYMLLVQKGMDGAQGAPGPSGIVVVATSTAGYTEADCNFLCDGTNDAATIKAAFDSLTKSNKHGTVLLLGGTYLLEKQLVIPENSILCGIGFETVLKVNNADTGTFSGPIWMRAHSTIRDMTIDGNADIFDQESNATIATGNISESSLVFHCRIINYDWAIRTNNTYGYESNGIDVICCIFEGNDTSSIAIDVAYRPVIAFNYIINSSIGIGIIGGICIGNYIENTNAGILALSAKSKDDADNFPVIIAGNTIRGINRSYGIMMQMGDHGVIIGNCLSAASWQSNCKSIYLMSDATNNLIIGNLIWGKNYLDEGTGNTWVNNKYN